MLRPVVTLQEQLRTRREVWCHNWQIDALIWSQNCCKATRWANSSSMWIRFCITFIITFMWFHTPGLFCHYLQTVWGLILWITNHFLFRHSWHRCLTCEQGETPSVEVDRTVQAITFIWINCSSTEDTLASALSCSVCLAFQTIQQVQITLQIVLHVLTKPAKQVPRPTRLTRELFIQMLQPPKSSIVTLNWHCIRAAGFYKLQVKTHARKK